MSEFFYRASIRSAVRGFWTGIFDFFDFFEVMESVIRSGLRRAWAEGADSCGIEELDFSPIERASLQSIVMREINRINGFATFIESNSKANGGKLTTVFKRAEMWANRYKQALSSSLAIVCKDQKLEWVYDPSKENCRSCARLNGKVKRASFWQRSGIIPRVPNAPYLECKGFNCGCVLTPTKKPMSRGPMPGLP